MKYESTILKRLIDTYGVVGNPRYISEIIKEFIVRGKESFPNLFTYQADWLAHIDEFGLTPDYVVSYTGQQIYAPHTKEKPVKSAILKGQTLVNTLSTCINKPLTKTTNTGHIQFLKPLESGKEYTIIISLSNAVTTTNAKYLNVRGNKIDGSYASIYDAVFKITNGIQKVKFTPTDGFATCLVGIGGNAPEGSTATIDYLMFIEGDHTQVDIPYFTGMQSVKMPVLTTTGKNLFDEKATGLYDETIGKIVVTNSQPVGITKIQTIRLEKGTYTLSLNNVSVDSTKPVEFRFNDFMSSKLMVNSGANYATFTVTESNQYDFIIFAHGSGTINRIEVNIQLEKNSINTLYEPYKSNILTTPEDLELRGIGDVKDELNLMTGELTQRIVEIVLDGSEDENWVYQDATTSCNVYLKLQQEYDKNYGRNLACDKLRIGALTSINHDNVGIGLKTSAHGDEIIINVLKSSLDTQDKQGFKKWLSENPITFQYPLLKESIKTVDLTILDQNGQNVKQLMSFNGGTHFTTSSQDGSLLPMLTVDVVTDLEEILMVCSSEGNTM